MREAAADVARRAGDRPAPAHERATPLAVVESCIGTFFATVLLLGIGIPLILVGVELFLGDLARRAKPIEWVAWAVVTCGWLVFDLPYNLAMWGRIRAGRHPSALTVALDRVQRRVSLPGRLVAALWWLGHTALGLFVVLLVEQMRPAEFAGDDDRPGAAIAARAMIFLLSFALAYAMHGFLLMAAAALTRSGRVVSLLWRIRVPADLVLATIAVLIPRLVAD